MVQPAREPTASAADVSSTPWLTAGYLACPSYPGEQYRCLGDQLYDLVEFSRFAEVRAGTMMYGRRGPGASKPERFLPGYLPFLAARGEARYWGTWEAENIPNPSAYWAGIAEPLNWSFRGWMYATEKAARLLTAALNDSSPDEVFALHEVDTSRVLWPSSSQWRWKVGQWGRKPLR
jgi:hypothetical protein